MALTCADCGAQARDDARFCASCGAGLTRSCPGCGVAVEPGARFCSSCGESLSRSATVPAVAPSEERRIISVLFADLVGFTSHTERTDPEDSRRRLTVYHTRVRQDVERFGGRFEKLMGDGVFAVFGAPVAHEDDPERAVRAAVRVLESVQEFNEAQPHLALAVRVAVTTGEAVVQLEASPDREGIVGDVVNTASRLQSVASPGQVVVDERTFHATRHAIEFEGSRRRHLQRQGGQAIGVAGHRAPEPVRSGGGRGNRDRFRRTRRRVEPLTDTFDRAVTRRRPQLVTVVGEPGVGKSRLIREFRRVIDDRPDLVWWRQGRCLPYGEGVTFWAIGEVVKAHAGILDSEPSDVVATKLHSTVAALFDDPEEAAWVELRLASLVGLPGLRPSAPNCSRPGCGSLRPWPPGAR